MARGPEYAEHLTGAERRVLDALLAELDPAPVAGRSRRSWRSPLAVGVLSLLILLAAAAVPLLRATAPPVGEDTAAPSVPSAADVLSALATAAAEVRDPSGPAEQWYRHRLDVRVSTQSCGVTAVTTELWETADTDRWHLLTGLLVAQRVVPPAGAAALAGCTTPKPSPPSPVLKRASDVPGVDWYEMVQKLGFDGEFEERGERYSQAWPAYVDPRSPALELVGMTSARLVGEALLESALLGALSTNHAALWWMAFGSVLTSPVADSALRSAALRAAAARQDAVLVPELAADVTGRPGVTLRVPFNALFLDRTADLTFDVATGALLQQVVYTDSGIDVTTYLAARRL